MFEPLESCFLSYTGAILKTHVVFNYTSVRMILQKSVCDVEYGYIKINTWA